MDGNLTPGPWASLTFLRFDKAGSFVVIELKAGKAADSVCGQILGYIAWVRKEPAGGQKVRGIIVASEFSDRLRYAAEAVGSLALIQHNITFTFSDVTALAEEKVGG